MAANDVYVYPKPAGGSVPSGAATEAKQDVMISELQDIEADIESTNSKLDTLNANDFATEAKQDTIIAGLVSIDSGVASIDSKTIKSDTDDVTVTSSVLPTGAATEAKQDSEISLLTSIDGKITEVDTGNVTVVSSALPTGAATSAKQDDQTALLTTIDGDTGNIATSVASLDTKSVQQALNFGAVADALRVASILGNSSGELSYGLGAAGTSTLRVALSNDFQAANGALGARLSDGSAFYKAPTDAQFPSTLGQKAKATSLAVTLASDEDPLDVNVDFTGVATEAKQDAEIALLTTIDADTGAIATSVASLDTKAVQQVLNFGAATGALRVAAVLGNASGIADFGSGALSSSTLRVVLATDQPNVNVIQKNALVQVTYDTVVPDFSGGTTDVYAYKTGGTGGSTVATVTITYTDSSKAVIQSVVRT